mmetsp:Transcript_6565/g.16606  ORF Transcript_6565/g.16606 Transcript_6565/m.16606 type:complete len:82 (-) Transcript_6565:1017-1262(-)
MCSRGDRRDDRTVTDYYCDHDDDPSSQHPHIDVRVTTVESYYLFWIFTMSPIYVAAARHVVVGLDTSSQSFRQAVQQDQHR